jgi:hypothetical protein
MQSVELLMRSPKNIRLIKLWFGMLQKISDKESKTRSCLSRAASNDKIKNIIIFQKM